MKKRTFLSKGAISFFVMAAFVAGGLTASAQTAGTTTSPAPTGGSAAASARMLSRGTTEIDSRITSMNQLSTRIQAMVHLTDAEKSALASSLTNVVSDLNTLKAKLSTDTDKASLKADVGSITKTYRVYALVEPQGRIAAASDRIMAVTSIFQTVITKLTTAITAAQTAGHDVTALQTALTDMTAKSTDAQTQAQAAVSGVSSLTPDNGVATVAQSNKQALTTARAAIKTATDDLKTARQDAQTIVQGLKAFGSSTSQTTTTTTQ